MYDKKTNSYLPTMSGLGMHVEIKDPDEKVVLSRMYSSEGRFSITSHTAGEEPRARRGVLTAAPTAALAVAAALADPH